MCSSAPKIDRRSASASCPAAARAPSSTSGPAMGSVSATSRANSSTAGRIYGFTAHTQEKSVSSPFRPAISSPASRRVCSTGPHGTRVPDELGLGPVLVAEPEAQRAADSPQIAPEPPAMGVGQVVPLDGQHTAGPEDPCALAQVAQHQLPAREVLHHGEARDEVDAGVGDGSQPDAVPHEELDPIVGDEGAGRARPSRPRRRSPPPSRSARPGRRRSGPGRGRSRQPDRAVPDAREPRGAPRPRPPVRWP